jgi:hypothetical protein
MEEKMSKQNPPVLANNSVRTAKSEPDCTKLLRCQAQRKCIISLEVIDPQAL